MRTCKRVTPPLYNALIVSATLCASSRMTTLPFNRTPEVRGESTVEHAVFHADEVRQLNSPMDSRAFLCRRTE